MTPSTEAKQVFLPSTKDDKDESKRLWVVMNVGPMTGRDMMSYNAGDPSGLNVMRRLTSRITEWNLKNPHGEAVPITLDNVSGLLLDDVIFLRQTMDNEVPKTHGLEKDDLKV